MKKRIIALLLVLVMSVSLIGCSKNNDTDDNTGIEDNNEVDDNNNEEPEQPIVDDDVDDGMDDDVDENDDNDNIDDNKDDMDDNGDMDDNKDDVDENDDVLSDEVKAIIKSDLFEAVTNYEVGTAGSSFDSVAISADWLNVIGEYDINEDELIKELTDYYNSLSAEDQELFKENYSLLREVMLMVAERDEYMMATLNDAGESLSDDALDRDDFVKFDKEIVNFLGL